MRDRRLLTELKKQVEERTQHSDKDVKNNPFKENIRVSIKEAEKPIMSEDELFEEYIKNATKGYTKQVEISQLMHSDSKNLPKFTSIDQYTRYNQLASKLNVLLERYKGDYLKSCKELKSYYDKESAEHRIIESIIAKQNSLDER